jgi:adenylate kinase family enzyme
MFPEGTRGEAGELQDFLGGIGLIARKRPDVPIVPAYLEGPERVLPRRAAVPLPLWNHITIGPPQVLGGDSRAIASSLYDHLKALADEERAYRQHRLPRPPRAFAVAVIGIDGSGKSTVSRRLTGCFRGDICHIGDGLELYRDGERCEAQPLTVDEVRKWMGRRAKRASNLARYKIPKLAELLLRDRLLSEVERWYRPALVFTDGSPLLNMTAWSVLYHEESFNAAFCAKALDALAGDDGRWRRDPVLRQIPELGALRKLHLNHLHLPDAVIFLDVEPERSVERITARGQAVQAHENLEKLTKLREAYRLVCEVMVRRRPVRVLAGDKGLEEVVHEAKCFVTEVKDRAHEKD